jgi:general stress protein 26
MPEMTLKDLSEKMAKIDFAMLSTRTSEGAVASRPMSNNGEVEFTGDSFFFSDDRTRTIADIEGDAQVGLTFTGSTGLLGSRPLFIAIEGEGELIHDKSKFNEHWTKDLDRWFPQGVDSPGLVLIKIHAKRIHYWNGTTEGELAL